MIDPNWETGSKVGGGEINQLNELHTATPEETIINRECLSV
jgi:hypothetical protein